VGVVVRNANRRAASVAGPENEGVAKNINKIDIQIGFLIMSSPR